MQQGKLPGTEPATATSVGGTDASGMSTPAHRDLEMATLGRRMADGDVEAMGLFYDETCDASYGLACRLMDDRRHAESLLCDAHLFAWRTIRVPPPDPGSELRWFLSLVIDRYRATLAHRGAVGRGQ